MGIEAMEGEERRQRRQQPLSPVELESIRSLRTRQWFGLLELFERKSVSGVMMWNGYRGRRGLMVEAAKAQGIPVVFLERCAYPGFVQVDLDGVNAGARGLNSGAYKDQQPDEAIIRWFRASQRQRRGANPFAPAQKPAEDLPSRFLYCPLQVAADTQLSVFGGWIKDMPDFLSQLVKVSEALPRDMALVIRPHPSCRVGQASALQLALTNPKIRVIEGGTSAEMLEKCEGVVTVNSSVGLEAFAYEKPVITMGDCFYADEGLTTHAHDQATLRKLFSGIGDLSFDGELRMRFLTWLREDGFKRWPRHSRDPAAKALAGHVDTLFQR